MKVDEKTVRHIARLARIKISDGEVKALEGELTGILTWVGQLNEVDVANVPPMTRVVPEARDPNDPGMGLKQRADKITDGEKADDIVANAPMAEDHFFVVPKVVE